MLRLDEHDKQILFGAMLGGIGVLLWVGNGWPWIILVAQVWYALALLLHKKYRLAIIPFPFAVMLVILNALSHDPAGLSWNIAIATLLIPVGIVLALDGIIKAHKQSVPQQQP